MHATSRRTFLEATLTFAVVPTLSPSAAVEGGQPGTGRQPRIIVLDVNETLLDVGALAPQFARVFGSAAVLPEWFTAVVLYSQTMTIAGPYVDFGTIARAALQMTAAGHGRALAKSNEDEILRGLVSLPAHPDVRDGLDRLRAAGFRLVTLTNSAPAGVQQQLENAGISDYFERSFSVDTVRRFKPAPEVYRMVATELSVAPSALRLVAAHAWDVLGALRAGCAAAFVARPGKALYPLGGKPDIVANDLGTVAAEILKRDVPK